MNSIPVQWLCLPVAGHGQVMIDGQVYELAIVWLPWGDTEVPEVKLTRFSKQGDVIYRLHRQGRSFVCECPAARFRCYEQCKHVAGCNALLDQLTQHYRSQHGS